MRNSASEVQQYWAWWINSVIWYHFILLKYFHPNENLQLKIQGCGVNGAMKLKGSCVFCPVLEYNNKWTCKVNWIALYSLEITGLFRRGGEDHHTTDFPLQQQLGLSCVPQTRASPICLNLYACWGADVWPVACELRDAHILRLRTLWVLTIKFICPKTCKEQILLLLWAILSLLFQNK